MSTSIMTLLYSMYSPHKVLTVLIGLALKREVQAPLFFWLEREGLGTPINYQRPNQGRGTHICIGDRYILHGTLHYCRAEILERQCKHQREKAPAQIRVQLHTY